MKRIKILWLKFLIIFSISPERIEKLIGRLDKTETPVVEETKERIPRKIEIPENIVVEALTYWDEYVLTSAALPRYKFWKLVKDNIPELKGSTWNINTTKSTPFLIENLEG